MNKNTFVVYHKRTTLFLRILRKRYWQDARFATLAAAKACLTREAAKRPDIKASDYRIVESSEFRKIEKYEVVKNLITGKKVKQRVNTPLCCDPSSETYWSM